MPRFILDAALLVSVSLLLGCRLDAPPPSAPAASGGAEQLVFVSARSGTSGLWVLDLARGTVAPWLDTAAGEGSPRLDAARARLVHTRFPADDDGPALVVADTTVLFPDPNGDAAPVWSPDGRWIAYVAERDGQADLFLARPDGTREVRLTDDAVVDRYPAWAPGSDRLAIVRRLDGGWDLHVVSGLTALDPEAGPAADLSLERVTTERVTFDGTYVGHPAWAPDGSRLAFDTFPAADSAGTGGAEIAVLDLTTGAVTRLTERAGNDLVPAWSADGQRLAFGANSGDGWDLWLLDLPTGALTRLTEDPAYDGAPLFVPASALVR